LEKVSLDLEEEKEIYIVQEFCAYVIDWQKVVDSANWAILTQILKGTEIDDAKEIYQQNMHGSEC